MHILISGASGLIGKALLSELQVAGHQVSVLSTQKNNTSFSKDVRIHYWNPKAGYIDPETLNDIDVIFSLAGAKIAQRWTKENKKSILNSRVMGTRLLVDAIKHHKSHRVQHFISASAIGIYPSDSTRVYTESDSVKATSFPGEVVTHWEVETDKASSVVAHVSKIRIGLVLAKEGGALLPLAVPASLGFGAWFGSGKQWQSWIHIQDLVRMFVFSIENPGCYNGVAPHPATQKELVKAIAKTYRMPQWLPSIPAFAIHLAMGKMASVLFDSIHASSAHATAKGFVFQFPTLDAALENLLPLRSKK